MSTNAKKTRKRYKKTTTQKNKQVPQSKGSQVNTDPRHTTISNTRNELPTGPANLSTTGRDNDPNWYYLNADIADQASTFSFNSYIGVPTELPFYPSGTSTVKKIGNFHVPSILAIGLNPCPGDTSTIQRGINMASLATYSTLSSINAKTTSYAPQDITILTLSLGEVISIMEHIRRMFGVFFLYNQRNRDVPRQLIEAMGFNFDDIAENVAGYRLEFNSWITAINKIPFLDNISYLYKCADLYQTIYMDSQSDMAQIVFSRPTTTWTLKEDYNEQGSGLVTTELPVRGALWSEWASIVQNMIDALLTSSTFNFIYSDMINYSTKTGAKLLYMDILKEDYAVLPVYNRNYLMQMHNLTIIGKPAPIAELLKISGDYGNKTTLNDVRCDVNKNIISYDPGFIKAEPNGGLSSVMLDCDTSTPSVEDRIEFTRFQAILKPDKTSAGTEDTALTVWIPDAMCDHYVTDITIYSTAFAKELSEGRGYPASVTNSVLTPLDMVTTDTAGYNTTGKAIFSLMSMDWSPILYLNIDADYPNVVDERLILPMTDVNYFTALDVEWFKRVNDLTFQGLFMLR